MVSSVLRVALLAALFVVGSAKPYGSQANQAPIVVMAAPPAKAPTSDYAAPVMDTPVVVQPVAVPAPAPQTYAAMQLSSAESHEELAVHQAKPSIVEGYFAMAVASVPTENAVKPTPQAADTPAPVQQATYGSAPTPVAAANEELPLNRLTVAPTTSSYGQQAAPVVQAAPAAVQTPSYNSAPKTVEVPVAVQIPIEKLSEYTAQTPLAPIQVVELPASAPTASYNAPSPAAAQTFPQMVVVAMPSTQDSAYGAQQTPVQQATPVVAEVPAAPATPSYGSQPAPAPIVVMPLKQQDVPAAPTASAYAAPAQQLPPSFVQPAEAPKPQLSYATELPAAPVSQPILMSAAPAPTSYSAPMHFDIPAIAQPTLAKSATVSAY